MTMRNEQIQRWIGASLFVASLSVSGPTSAQSTSPIQATDRPSSELGEIIVTARKRQETILNVPIVETAITQAQLDRASKTLAAASEGDAVIWFAYPKGTSKRYTCEFNRDSGWKVIVGAGFESVRMVAIDEDWSALRFRRVEFVKPKKT